MNWGGSASYTVMPPANVGNAALIYPVGDRPQTLLFGRGGYPTDGQLSPIPGGRGVVSKSVLAGLPGVIVATPGGAQRLKDR